MAALLQRILERAELSKLSKAVQGKLEKHLAEQQSDADYFKAQYEQLRVDSGEYTASLLSSPSPCRGLVNGLTGRGGQPNLGSGALQHTGERIIIIIIIVLV